VEKHADYLLIAQHVIVVVEETSRAKTDDVKKLEKTIEALLHGSLRDFLPIDIQPKQIVAVIHAHRGVDPMISRIRRTKTKKGIAYRIAKCGNSLKTVLKDYGVQP